MDHAPSGIAKVASQAYIISQLPQQNSNSCTNGKHEEATDILTQLHGKGIQCSDLEVIKQKSPIDAALALENAEGPWKATELFKNGPLKIRRHYLLAVGAQAVQQLSGIDVLVYYALHVLTTSVGLSYETALQVGVGLADTYWGFSLTGAFFLDQMGRRKPLIWGALGCSLCFHFVYTHFSISITNVRSNEIWLVCSRQVLSQ